MEISEIGEFGLIDRLVRRARRRELLVGVGDDAAVMDLREKIVLTTDMLVEGDHFRTDWSTPVRIGRKAMDSNVSDIAAMGAVPAFAFVSICLREGIDVEFMDLLYSGMYEVAKRYDIDIAGGDTTHGAIVVINICIVGTVERPVLRSGASPGQPICVTGPLGGSRAGLELLLAGRTDGPREAIEKHLDPGCRMDVALEIASVAASMIDVSDGLASEVNHICDMSGVGAEVDASAVPLAPSTLAAAELLGADPLQWALGGGEDFELVFTANEGRLAGLKVPYTVVGRTLPASKGRWLVRDGKKKPLAGGFDHFRK
ncbi:MAG: thiamine-phosphate kinase [Thermoplasmata archaeon]|nr:thiamine-phosphate kinase [Thermoplasmata archaeon]